MQDNSRGHQGAGLGVSQASSQPDIVLVSGEGETRKAGNNFLELNDMTQTTNGTKQYPITGGEKRFHIISSQGKDNTERSDVTGHADDIASRDVTGKTIESGLSGSEVHAEVGVAAGDAGAGMAV